jgi:uncharacterized protein YbaA (DUF1428 family)
MKYVDGYVLPVPKKKIAAYRKLAQMGAKLWMKHGALEYYECAGDDLKSKWGTPFPKQMKLKAGETAVFSFVVFKSKAHRDSVNAKVMKDPSMANMDPNAMPFDVKRMLYGGFKVIVEG